MKHYNELDEARQLICKSVYCHLKDHIKGVVKVYPSKMFIVVEIYGVNDIKFTSAYNLQNGEIVQGFDSIQFAQNVIKWYKRYITNLFFFNK